MLEVLYLGYMERRNKKRKKKIPMKEKTSTITSYVASMVATFASWKKGKWMIDCRHISCVKLYYIKYGLVPLGGTWWLVTYTKIIGLKTTLFILN